MARSETEHALSGVDSCQFAIDEKGVKRLATEQQKKKCMEGNGKMPAYGKSASPVNTNPSSSTPFSSDDMSDLKAKKQ